MKKTNPLVLTSLLSLSAWSFPAFAQDNATAAPAGPPPAAAPAPAPEVVPAVPVAAPPPAPKKKGGSAPALGLDPSAPQVGGLVTTTSDAPAAVEEPVTGEWKFDVTGYFRAPLRFSWGPPTTPNMDTGSKGSAGTQIRTPPLVPDANYIDWRYTNSMVGPWTELNFHYGNDRVKATVQIASYNVTDSGYRRLESNLGINEAFLSMTWPEFISENARLTLIAGAYTNRYGAAGRYDAGRYETYLFGRTHTAGQTLTYDYDWNDWTFEAEEGFGGKLEPIPFYGPPLGNGTGINANQNLPAWEPYPGPVPQESTFVFHAHAGAVFKKEVIVGAHYIDVFSNDNERAGSYQGSQGAWDAVGANNVTMPQPARLAQNAKPNITIYGADVKLLGGVLGDGYLGYSHLSATNALYIADAIEVLHSFGGWQLHDNYFGPPGATDQVTGTIDSVELQYSFSFGQLFHYPQAFWGDGPDLIGTVFGMYNHVKAPENTAYSLDKLKFGTEWTYVPLPWLGLGARYDVVEPNLDLSGESFSVISPRIIFRTAFVTHEQVMIQYSRYFYGDFYTPGRGPQAGYMSGSQFPYNSQSGAAGLGVDKNAAQIAAIIWF